MAIFSNIETAKQFTKDELEAGQRIFHKHKGEPAFQNMKDELRDKIVKPALSRIYEANERSADVAGQQIDADYLAYALILMYQQIEK